LAWQFQIRYFPGAAGSSSSAGKKGKGEGPSAAAGGGGAGGVSGSYQSVMMGGGAAAQPGAVSKAKLRTEADLSPTEGKLILVEYCEERPLLQLGKGMAFKIVNYYRGDKSRCPVSRGGGDRPARRKRPGVETSGDGSGEGGRKGSAGRRGRGSGGLARLEGPRETSVLDWVGELPKRKPKDRAEKEAIDILPEGVTEILHPKGKVAMEVTLEGGCVNLSIVSLSHHRAAVHGPFIGEVEEGTTLTGLISNLFVAPMFRHEPEQTDFLMILTPPGGAARPGHREAMGVVLRDLPSSVFTVGQTEPRTRVYAPNTNGEKNFVGPFISYQIAKALTRSELREGHGLRFDEIQDRVLPNLDIAANALRQRLKQVAVYDKNTQIWTTKAIGYEDYPGVDALGKSISPESVAAFETATAATRRLADLGIHQLCTGSHIVASVGVTMVYLVGQVNAARELARKSKKLLELSRTNRSITAEQIKLYEKAAAELDAIFKVQRQKYEIAQFIYEELQLTPWHLTGEFIDVHKKGEGTGEFMLRWQIKMRHLTSVCRPSPAFIALCQECLSSQDWAIRVAPERASASCERWKSQRKRSDRTKR
jgi:transcription initiation factor TFIID subunit 1